MKRILHVVMLLLLLTGTASANVVKLVWDKNTEADVVGYNVYRSTASGEFTTSVNGVLVPHPGTGTANVTYTDNTPANVVYYYVVRAVNQAGLESGNSNQVTANPLPPKAPTGLGIDSLTTVNLLIDGQQVAAASGGDIDDLRYILTVPRQNREVKKTLSIRVMPAEYIEGAVRQEK